MANPSKEKGTAWESAIVAYLRRHHDETAHRNVQMGRLDIGDIDGYYLNALEAKAEKAITLAEYVRQANREARNAKQPFGVSVVKRRNANVKDAYAVRDLETDARLINRLRDAEMLLQEHAYEVFKAHYEKHGGGH